MDLRVFPVGGNSVSIYSDDTVTTGVTANLQQGPFHCTLIPDSRVGGLWKSNYRTARFATVGEAIDRLSKLPTGHPLHLDPVVANRATHFLLLLRDNVRVGVPQVYPHEDHALVMTWDVGNVEKFLSIESDGIEVKEMLENNSLKPLYEAEEGEVIDLGLIATSLGAELSTESV